MIAGLAYLAAYALLAGFASFIEVPAGRGYRAFQLNALIRGGSLIAALAALGVAHGLALPIGSASLAALGIGIIAGFGSISYCFAVSYISITTVATLSNLYLIVTTVLGISILGESVTVLKVIGVIATLAGALLLDFAPARFGIGAGHDEVRKRSMRPFLIMAVYVVLVGVSTFLEKPVLSYLDPTQLNALIALGMTAVALIALAVRGPALPVRARTLLPAGVGFMIGIASVLYFLALRGLPVSVAAALSNASVIVTVALSAVFLRQRLNRQKALAIALTLLGVTTLAGTVA